MKRRNGEGTINKDGYRVFVRNYKFQYGHREIAEKALGKALPVGAIVHHVDEDTANNDPNNLVICPNHLYHMLLHRRAAALDACGNATYVKCRHCESYDDMKNLVVDGSRSFSHRQCRSVYRKSVYAARKSA